MIHPYIYCAHPPGETLRRKRTTSPRSPAIPPKASCTGCVNRWPAKQSPPNAYAAKFSTPFCMAAGFFLRRRRPRRLHRRDRARPAPSLRSRPRFKYIIYPDNPYPDNYTGHLQARLKDGREIEERQPHLRGGAQEPLSRQRYRGQVLRQRRILLLSPRQSHCFAPSYRAIVQRTRLFARNCAHERIAEQASRWSPASSRNICRAISLSLAESRADVAVNALTSSYLYLNLLSLYHHLYSTKPSSILNLLHQYSSTQHS